MTGLFLTFEGIEGSGKTTQVRRLESWLAASGRQVLTVREPGGTGMSERIREILLSREGEPVEPWAELCLYLASRAQLVSERIRPALARGAVVIADRFGDASVAYQGAGRSLGTAKVRTLNRLVTRGLVPERTFLLDLEPAVGLKRIVLGRGAASLDRLESEPVAFHRKIRREYLRSARREPERFRVLDALLPPEILEERIRAEVLPLLSPASPC